VAQGAYVRALGVTGRSSGAAVNAELEAGTLRLTFAALGAVLGLSGAAVLPLLLPWQGQALIAGLSALLGLLPTALAWCVPRLRKRAQLERLLPVTTALAVGCALLTVPLFHVYRGEVRVLNHGEEPFIVLVDGRPVARVEPSSGESALAGAELTVPAGERTWRVRRVSDGVELFSARELVEGGKPHLFAPQSAGYCFRIERRSYGEGASAQTDVVPLEGENPFWVLPEGINWFVPNPEPGPLRTSGGTLACLRQRRCDD
jgi:hypothetical protein